MASPSQLTPAMLEVLLNGPAMPPPSGISSNFSSPQNFANAMLVIELVFLILSSVTIFMRLYTKLRINRKGDLEDLLCFLAWGAYIGLFVVARRASHQAGGRHQYDVQLKNMSNFLYNLHVGSIMYGCIVFAIKAAILLQYITIFSSAARGLFFWSCHILIWMNFVFYAICSFLEIFSCKPIAKAWDPFITTGTCPVDVLVLNIVASAVNVASDLIILLLPQVVIWRLKMSTQKRVGVSLIFATASLACVSAALRLYYCVLLYHSEDATWYVSMMAIYMFCELGLGIMVSCLPAVSKFVRTFAENTLFSHVGTSFYSLLGMTNHKKIHPRSNEISPGRNEVSSIKKKRLDSFQKLVEEHELQSTFKEEPKENVVAIPFK